MSSVVLELDSEELEVVGSSTIVVDPSSVPVPIVVVLVDAALVPVVPVPPLDSEDALSATALSLHAQIVRHRIHRASIQPMLVMSVRTTARFPARSCFRRRMTSWRSATAGLRDVGDGEGDLRRGLEALGDRSRRCGLEGGCDGAAWVAVAQLLERPEAGEQLLAAGESADEALGLLDAHLLRACDEAILRGGGELLDLLLLGLTRLLIDLVVDRRLVLRLLDLLERHHESVLVRVLVALVAAGPTHARLERRGDVERLARDPVEERTRCLARALGRRGGLGLHRFGECGHRLRIATLGDAFEHRERSGVRDEQRAR